MRLVLDAGALIAIERADRQVAALIILGRRGGAELVTIAPVVGQVWRDGTRQVHLSRALPMIDVMPVDLGSAQVAGELMGETGRSDVVDALLALAVRAGDQVLTSDPDNIAQLLQARQVPAVVVRV